MATKDEAKQAILDEIVRTVNGPSAYVLHLAEAYAWLNSPSQSHGGSSAKS